MNNNQRLLAKKAKEETLKTVRQIDDNIWVMNYKCSYGLEGILNQGSNQSTINHILQTLGYSSGEIAKNMSKYY